MFTPLGDLIGCRSARPRRLALALPPGRDTPIGARVNVSWCRWSPSWSTAMWSRFSPPSLRRRTDPAGYFLKSPRARTDPHWFTRTARCAIEQARTIGRSSQGGPPSQAGDEPLFLRRSANDLRVGDVTALYPRRRGQPRAQTVVASWSVSGAGRPQRTYRASRSPAPPRAMRRTTPVWVREPPTYWQARSLLYALPGDDTWASSPRRRHLVPVRLHPRDPLLASRRLRRCGVGALPRSRPSCAAHSSRPSPCTAAPDTRWALRPAVNSSRQPDHNRDRVAKAGSPSRWATQPSAPSSSPSARSTASSTLPSHPYPRVI